MLRLGHFHPHLRQLAALFLGTIMLVSCGSPAPAVVPTNGAVTPTAAVSPAPAPGMSNVIPRPVSVLPTGGTFVLTANTGIYVEPVTDEVKAIGQYLADHINPSTSYAIKVQAANGGPQKGAIFLTLSGADASLGDEGYQLTITPDLVKVAANRPAGLFYGIQTIRQLLPPAIDSSSVQPGPWSMATGTITDTPRFAWRGAMLDVARHFFSVKDVTSYIDLLAYYKINRLHLHLTDDQGWRIQIKSWPNLALYGGSLEVGGTPGGYYSQDDYSYIVSYAQSRYITIIPEIDMPGHIRAALASYSDLNCNGVAPDLFTGTDVGFSSICVNKDSTNTFVEDVIGELAGLTPGPYIHIGGDEAQGTNLPDYINFVKRVQSIVAADGKQVVGWEEIAQAPLLPSSITQHWNIDPGLAVQAVHQGAKVIMSPANKAYLDMKYQPSTTLGQDWAGYINLETAYSWDPATLINGVTEKDILGVEAPLWSETLNSLDDLEYMAFPRMLGYAEIGWTPQAERNWSDYMIRLAAQGPRLEALGVHFYPSSEVTWP
ncbi:MAG: beta-N-acetylhexosaminidase [Anaerolineales bacterium]